MFERVPNFICDPSLRLTGLWGCRALRSTTVPCVCKGATGMHVDNPSLHAAWRLLPSSVAWHGMAWHGMTRLGMASWKGQQRAYRMEIDQEYSPVCVVNERGVDSGAGGVVESDVDLICSPSKHVARLAIHRQFLLHTVGISHLQHRISSLAEDPLGKLTCL